MSEHGAPLPLDELPRLITMQVQVPDGANGVISLATNVDQFVSRGTIDRMLDLLAGAAERQRAKRQLPALRAEHEETQKLLDENRVRLAGMVAGYEEAARTRNEHIGRARADRTVCYQQGAAEWSEGGRRGEYEPRGQIKIKLNKYDTAIAQAEALQKKDDEEHKVACSQLDNEISRRQTAVDILARRIAECEALERGEDVADSRPSLYDSA